MAEARDGEELGNALKDPENYRLEESDLALSGRVTMATRSGEGVVRQIVKA